jgi:hypothetical protein
MIGSMMLSSNDGKSKRKRIDQAATGGARACCGLLETSGAASNRWARQTTVVAGGCSGATDMAAGGVPSIGAAAAWHIGPHGHCDGGRSEFGKEPPACAEQMTVRTPNAAAAAGTRTPQAARIVCNASR